MANVDNNKREYISYYHEPCKTNWAIDVTFVEITYNIAITTQYQTSFHCPKCNVDRTIFYEEGDVTNEPKGEKAPPS